MNAEELIKREIEVDPFRPGPANMRLRRSGVPIWALIGYYLYAVKEDEQALARDYNLTADEVTAAVQYYYGHRAEIDGRIEASQPLTTS